MIDINNTEKLLENRNILGTIVPVAGRTIVDLTASYEDLIIEVVKAKYLASSGPEAVISCCSKLITWLRSSDFYTAPASTRYHEAHAGGLLVHTLNVYNNTVTLRCIPQFASTDLVSAALVALTHDWCKISMYESYEKNVKNEKTGEWEKQLAFRTNQTGITLGHGVSSMFLASKFFRLTPEEALAIRWHMSHWRVAQDEINELQKSNEDFPLVHLVQFADQLSITKYANLSFSK